MDSGNAPPTFTIPPSGIPTKSAAAVTIGNVGDGLTVTEGTDPISSISLSCSGGDLTVTLSGSVVVSAGANGSANMTLASGASETEYNTVLATLTYKGDSDFRGKDTITITVNDGTFSPAGNFYVLNDTQAIKLTKAAGGTYANLIAAANLLYGTLVSGSTGNILMTSTDDQAGVDVDTITLNIDTPVPTITSDGGGDTAAVNAAENQTAVTTVTATDPSGFGLTYFLDVSGGVDHAHFSIDMDSGVLTFNTAKGFFTPDDDDTDGVYEVSVGVSNGSYFDYQDISVTVTNVAPIITNESNAFIYDGLTTVRQCLATDGPGTTLTWSITGGDDAGFFSIGSSSGILTFDSPPDFNDPQDLDTDNVYEVTVQVSDSLATDTQAISVEVIERVGGLTLRRRRRRKRQL